MKAVKKWLEKNYEHLQNDFDQVVPVVGDEGMGKSTLITELGWLWLDVVDEREQTVENTMNQIAWNLEEFKTYIGSKPQYSCIAVHDAARVLSRKKAMHGDQIEVEEDLLDMRFGNYLVLLGYQEFDLLPTMLATRRSKQLLRIPKRGVVHGHNESNIRQRYEEGDWPDPVMRDTYPSLEGKDLWNAFKAEDARRKQERIQPDEDEDGESQNVSEIVEMVIEDGIDNVVSINSQNGQAYIDAGLIEYEYSTSGNKAKKARSVLRKKAREGDIEAERL